MGRYGRGAFDGSLFSLLKRYAHSLPLVHLLCSYRCVDLDVGSRISGSIEDAYHVIRYTGIASSPLFHHATLYGCSLPHTKLRG